MVENLQPRNDTSPEYVLDSVSTTSSTREDDRHHRDSIVSKEDQYYPLEEPPTFGNVSVANSSDVHFGNKTFYHGPVTIKQFLYSNGTGSKTDDCDSESAIKNLDTRCNGSSGGYDNPVFSAKNIVISNGVETFKENLEYVEDSNQCWKGSKWKQIIVSRWKLLIVSVCLSLILTGILIAMVPFKRSSISTTPHSMTFPTGDTDEQDEILPIDSPIDPQTGLALPRKLKIVSRVEWLAQPPVNEATDLKLPVPYVIIMHTATENCSYQARCILHTRRIQMYHIESNGWWDIGYNFLIGGDGEAYEGRGWKKEGAHTFSYNYKSIGIAFIGTFLTTRPPQSQLVTCQRLIQKGVDEGYLQKNYTLLAARQLQGTQSPGAALYEIIKTWPHWTPNVTLINEESGN